MTSAKPNDPGFRQHAHAGRQISSRIRFWYPLMNAALKSWNCHPVIRWRSTPHR